MQDGVASVPQTCFLPKWLTQLGAFARGPGSSWETIVARVDDESRVAITALPVGSRCIVKRRKCVGIGSAEQLVRDVWPLSVLDHPNVVKYYGAFLSPASTDVLLLCEFCSRGSLLDLIHNQRKVAGFNDVDESGARQKGLQKADLFAAELVLEILVQISLGLKYLHDDMALAHGNLTSANVVLDGSGMVKITDVGLEDAIDSTDSNGAHDARDGMTRGKRGGRGYWSPERSLAIANGGFLSSEPTAPADCWAMGCVASELLSGVFVDERLQLFESISLAQEHKVLAAILTEVEHLSSCGQCGQSGKDTCAGCRVAWVTAALLTREATRRPVAGRVASLLENPATVGRLESAQVGRTAVPPLSIPPPWHRRAGNGGAKMPRTLISPRNGKHETEVERADTDARSILSAVRAAIDGPDWRVFKDGKLVQNAHEWHHDSIIIERSCDQRTPTPHPRPHSPSDPVLLLHQHAHQDETPTATSSRQRVVVGGGGEGGGGEERKVVRVRRGLADLYKEAKDKQRQHADTGATLQPSNTRKKTLGAQASHADADAEQVDAERPPKDQHANSNGDEAAARSLPQILALSGSGVPQIQVPLSSLKEGKAKSCSGNGVMEGGVLGARAYLRGASLGIGGVQGFEQMFARATEKASGSSGGGSSGGSSASTASGKSGKMLREVRENGRGVGGHAQPTHAPPASDVWQEWLKSLARSSSSSPELAARESEEELASWRHSSHEHAGGAGEREEEEEEEHGDTDVGEMGPQEIMVADMQMNALGTPRATPLTTTTSIDQEEQGVEGEDATSRHVCTSGRGMRGGRREAETETGVDEAATPATPAAGDARDGSERRAAPEKNMVEGRGQELWRHTVTVKNLAGNKVHVLGAVRNHDAAPSEALSPQPLSQPLSAQPLSDQAEAESQARNTEQSTSTSTAAEQPQLQHDSGGDGEGGGVEEAESAASSAGQYSEGKEGGIVAHGGGGAMVEIKAELVSSKTVGGEGDGGVGVGGGREVYTVYVLSVEGAGIVWQVGRRYSDFLHLHHKLLSTLPAGKGGASRARAALAERMPKKALFGGNSPELVKQRLTALTSYVGSVQRVLQQHSLGTRVSAAQRRTACAAWVEFCAVPSTAFAAAALLRHPAGSRSPCSSGESRGWQTPRGGGGGGGGGGLSTRPQGVLRRPHSVKRQPITKRVQLQDGRRQVVWGSDGHLQMESETFIAGSSERRPGPRAYKNGMPRLVDPSWSRPHTDAWWLDDAFVDNHSEKQALGDKHSAAKLQHTQKQQKQERQEESAAVREEVKRGGEGVERLGRAGRGSAPEPSALKSAEAIAGSKVSLTRDLEHVARGLGPQQLQHRKTHDGSSSWMAMRVGVGVGGASESESEGEGDGGGGGGMLAERKRQCADEAAACRKTGDMESLRLYLMPQDTRTADAARSSQKEAVLRSKRAAVDDDDDVREVEESVARAAAAIHSASAHTPHQGTTTHSTHLPSAAPSHSPLPHSPSFSPDYYLATSVGEGEESEEEEQREEERQPSMGLTPAQLAAVKLSKEAVDGGSMTADLSHRLSLLHDVVTSVPSVRAHRGSGGGGWKALPRPSLGQSLAPPPPPPHSPSALEATPTSRSSAPRTRSGGLLSDASDANLHACDGGSTATAATCFRSLGPLLASGASGASGASAVVRVSADAKLQLLHASGASAGVNLGGLLAEEEEVAEAGGTASSGRLRENAGGSGGLRRWSQTAEHCNSCNMEHCNSCNMLQAEQRPDELHINGFQRQLREAPGPSLHTHPTAAGAEDALAADVERERGRERESASERPAEEEEEEDVWHTPQRVSSEGSEALKHGDMTVLGAQLELDELATTLLMLPPALSPICVADKHEGTPGWGSEPSNGHAEGFQW